MDIGELDVFVDTVDTLNEEIFIIE